MRGRGWAYQWRRSPSVPNTSAPGELSLAADLSPPVSRALPLPLRPRGVAAGHGGRGRAGRGGRVGAPGREPESSTAPWLTATGVGKTRREGLDWLRWLGFSPDAARQPVQLSRHPLLLLHALILLGVLSQPRRR